jgi:hypothetical protein
MKPEYRAGTQRHTGKDGCSTAAARVSDKRTPPSWGADGVLNLGTVTGGPGAGAMPFRLRYPTPALGAPLKMSSFVIRRFRFHRSETLISCGLKSHVPAAPYREHPSRFYGLILPFSVESKLAVSRRISRTVSAAELVRHFPVLCTALFPRLVQNGRIVRSSDLYARRAG